MSTCVCFLTCLLFGVIYVGLGNDRRDRGLVGASQRSSLLSRCLVLTLTVAPLGSESSCRAAEDSDGTWIQLFDGETLFGWQATSDANWRVHEGAITVDDGQPGFLMFNTAIGDFELAVEFNPEDRTNSGVFVRSTPVPKDPQTDCYEINIAGQENPFPTGSIVARQKRTPMTPQQGDWHQMTVRCVANRITVDVDEQSTVSLVDDVEPRLRGQIGLQFNQGPIQFRNIRFRPLIMQPLFNGQDLKGWVTHPDLAGDFKVEKGELRARGGLGQIETEQSFDDFVLQFECRTNVPLTNSGVFFRCIPRDKLMGYESQIHHGFRDGDRSQPTDGGSGAIFRHQDARRVVANDLEWFQQTIIAVNDQIATWVNGYPVCSWQDTRAEHDNPRQGKRLSAGTILIQAHDATTDVSFRNIRIAKIAKSLTGGP